MNSGKAPNPGAPSPLTAAAEAAAPSAALAPEPDDSEPSEERSSFFDDPDEGDDDEPYGYLAGARPRGADKGGAIPKMRANRDAGAGKKFNKPLHRDKRAP